MTIDNETRARWVREWMRSPLKQSEFCAAHGISTRALREWVRRFGTGDRPEARAVSIIDDTIERLRALREALVAEEACRVGVPDEPAGESDEEQELRHAESEGAAPSGTPEPVAEPPPVKRAPMPSAGFPWL
jgi:hypothetical protein